VLGDDAEALRLARQELEEVTEQLRREMAEAGGGQSSGQPGQEGSPQAGEGNQPGSGGRETQDGELAEAGNRPGQPGQGQQGEGRQASASGEQASEGQGGGEGQREGQGEGQGQGSLAQNQGGATAGESGQGRGGSPNNEARGEGRTGGLTQRGGTQRGGSTYGGGGYEGGIFGGEWAGNSGPLDLADLLEESREPGPLTGDEFADWSDRLRNVEELIDDPALRNEVATARERARTLRREYRQDQKKPDWAVVRLEIERPLIEVRNRLSEELARRDSRDPLVPIDRDPVPARFAEQVRRYYEELGKDRDE
jgi:hypothetical protein